MWNEKELFDQIDAYFDNITEKEFLADLEAAGCLELVEDIMPSTIPSMYRVDLTKFTIKASSSNNVKSGGEYNNLSRKFKTIQEVIKTEMTYKDSPQNNNNLAIGA